MAQTKRELDLRRHPELNAQGDGENDQLGEVDKSVPRKPRAGAAEPIRPTGLDPSPAGDLGVIDVEGEDAHRVPPAPGERQRHDRDHHGVDRVGAAPVAHEHVNLAKRGEEEGERDVGARQRPDFAHDSHRPNINRVCAIVICLWTERRSDSRRSRNRIDGRCARAEALLPFLPPTKEDPHVDTL